MKEIGKISVKSEITFRATPENLARCAFFNDEMQKFHAAAGFGRFFPKGVYRYKNHREANRHWREVIINKILEKQKHGT